MLNGARIMPVAVDEDGLQVDALQRLPDPPALAFVSPSHQYPTGARMSVARRLALLEWAREHDSLIVEDDYDSEFRFDAAPLPALAGLDEEGRVVYIGTFSKMLTPAIRVGYVLAPPLLRERIIQIKRLSDFHTNWPVQRVLARFLQTGLLETHIRRMRRYYAEKRALLTAQFEPISDLAHPRGFDAGLHAFVELAPDLSHSAVAARALAAGVGVTTIDEYFHGPVKLNGILLGYGGLKHAQIREGGRLLVGVITQLAGERRIAAD
jgi:GntR family transcriptional regulator/MocR family aminotransferase